MKPDRDSAWKWRGVTNADFTAWDDDFPADGEGWRTYISRDKVFQWRNQHKDEPKTLPLCERRMTCKSLITKINYIA